MKIEKTFSNFDFVLMKKTAAGRTPNRIAIPIPPTTPMAFRKMFGKSTAIITGGKNVIKMTRSL